MKRAIRIAAAAAVLFSAGTIHGQSDETRASGLPSMIGENVARGDRMNVSGRVVLETTGKVDRKPVIRVIVLSAGAPADSAIATDTGVYLIRNVPRSNVSIVVEIDGSEVTRQPLAAAAMGNPRVDFTFPWPSVAGAAKPGVVSLAPSYQRAEPNQAVFDKALAAERANDLRLALQYLDQLLSADAKDFTAWTEVGTIYFRSGNLDNAEGGYLKAIELKKDYFPALLNLGRLYMHRKQFDNAVLALTNAVAVSPASPEAHSLLGEAYLQTKKGSLAVSHLNQAIELAPNEMAELHLRLATLYDAAGARNRAASEYKLFLQKRPDYKEKQKLEDYIKSNPPK